MSGIHDTHALAQLRDKLLANPGDLDAFAAELERVTRLTPQRINADPEEVERGLTRLVLALVDLLRQLMERQALRRMETGTLDDDEVERLGQTFLKLEARMNELKQHFGLTDDDLNLDLGPLGRLLH
jgi:hypothetical protein